MIRTVSYSAISLLVLGTFSTAALADTRSVDLGNIIE